MKIGILTFHDGINFGAFLQAFSTQEKLKSLGHEVELIDYKKRSFAIKEYVHFIKAKGQFKKNFQKIKKFERTHKTYFNLSKYSSNLSKLEGRYDAVFFGSDEIWNINNPGFGYDLSYFGKGLSSTAKISYAPSFGSTQFDDPKLMLVKEYIEAFDAVSVRDINSQNIVEKLVGEKPSIVPDPTFLVDHRQWSVGPKMDEQYFLVYATVLNPEHIEAIRAQAKKEGIKLVSIGNYYDWCDENYIEIDPFEWIGFFDNAKYVFTSMFHGTIFSILMRKDFTIFMDPYRLQKFSFLLRELDLEKRIFKVGDTFEKIDYASIEKKIETYSNMGHNYIEKSLEKLGK